MARKPKQKLLTAVPAKFDPNFIERLNRNYSLAHVVLERREALEAHLGGTLSYVQQSLVKRCIWIELLAEVYEQKIANGEEIDVGALTQINNTLKGLYKDIGIKPTAKPVEGLRDIWRADAEAEPARRAAPASEPEAQPDEVIPANLPTNAPASEQST
jgi:hypothetical protein